MKAAASTFRMAATKIACVLLAVLLLCQGRWAASVAACASGLSCPAQPCRLIDLRMCFGAAVTYSSLQEAAAS